MADVNDAVCDVAIVSRCVAGRTNKAMSGCHKEVFFV